MDTKKAFCVSLVLILLCTQFIGVESAMATSLKQGSFDGESPPPGTQTGQPVTSFQISLQNTIDKRQALGLPTPSSVSYDTDTAVIQPSRDMRSFSFDSQDVMIMITSKTIVHYDNPEQAGYEKWPELTVEGGVPEGATGTIKSGNYNQMIYKGVEAEIPGIWDQYEFGYEPRTYVFTETSTGPSSQSDMNILNQLQANIAESNTVKEILLGFTAPGVDYDYTWSWAGEILGVKVVELTIGFQFKYDFGLRLPMEVGLNAPVLVPEGSSFLPDSYINGVDWSAEDYLAVGVNPFDGNEFYVDFTFFGGVKLWVILAGDFGPCIDISFQESSSYATPIGQGATFSLPPIQIPIIAEDLAIVGFEVGFMLQPSLGSDHITADWQAVGDFVGSGQLVYSEPLTPVSLAPMLASDGPSQTDLTVSDFRYYFTQVPIEYGFYGTIWVDIEIYSDSWTLPIPLGSIDIGGLTGSLYLGVHAGTDGSITRTVQIQNVPPTVVIDRTGTIPINGQDTFMGQDGDSFTFIGTATDPGADDLTLYWDWDDGPPTPDTATFYPVPYSVTESQTHTFAGSCLYNITLLAEDDDGDYGEDQVPVLISGTEDKYRYEGYWQSQFKLAANPANLECYLAIVRHMSTVFDEMRDASTIEAAYDILFLKGNGGSEIEQFDRELMVVWLNFATGAIGYSDLLDTDNDHVGDTPFYEVVLSAEMVRLDPNATIEQIREQTAVLHHIEQMGN